MILWGGKILLYNALWYISCSGLLGIGEAQLTLEPLLITDLQSCIDFAGGAGGFHVEDDMLGFKDGCDVHAVEFFVGYGGDGSIEVLFLGEFVDYF